MEEESKVEEKKARGSRAGKGQPVVAYSGKPLDTPMMQQNSNILDNLKNRELAGVSFIRDYVQFLFDGPMLNTYVLPVVNVAGQSFAPASPGYRDALCSLIGKLVVSTGVDAKHWLRLEFADDSSIELSLKDEDRSTPEAAMLQIDSGKKWNVW